jgi:flavodoxin
MKVLIAYDTAYGNTGKVAHHIATVLGAQAQASRIDTLSPAALTGIGLLVVASPTQAGQAAPRMRNWLASLPTGALSGVRVAAFDTRLAFGDKGFALNALMKLVGYAAPRMLRQLVAHGGTAAAEPAGFIVDGKEGPMRAGELDAAARWAEALMAGVARERDAA